MAFVGTEVVTRVRDLLQDEDAAAYRWSDAELLLWLNDSLQELVSRRPDSVTAAAVPEVTDLTAISDTMPVVVRWRSPLVDFVLTRCLQRDGDDANNLARAEHHRGQFILGIS